MSWARIHDSALNSPKLVKLFKASDPLHLWVWGLTYCQLHLTDGAIPIEAIPHGGVKAAEALIERRLWEASEGGYQIHDYLDWNESKEVISKKRASSRERVTRFRTRVTNAPTSSSNTRVHGNANAGRGVAYVSSSFKEKKIESEPDPVGARAGRLVERYAELFYQRRKGAKYHSRPALDFQKAMGLVQTWDDDARLEKLAILVLTTDDEWVSGTDRGFGVFASRASWADGLLAEWEAEQARKVGA